MSGQFEDPISLKKVITARTPLKTCPVSTQRGVVIILHPVACYLKVKMPYRPEKWNINCFYI
jgi:hypothetical protein